MAQTTKLPELTETQFLNQVIELARICGWRVCHFRPAQTAHGWRTAIQGDAGFPDLILLKGSRGIAWELKAGKGKATEDQWAWVVAFREAGFEADVWHPQHWDYIERVLTERQP